MIDPEQQRKLEQDLQEYRRSRLPRMAVGLALLIVSAIIAMRVVPELPMTFAGKVVVVALTTAIFAFLMPSNPLIDRAIARPNGLTVWLVGKGIAVCLISALLLYLTGGGTGRQDHEALRLMMIWLVVSTLVPPYSALKKSWTEPEPSA